MTELAYTVRDRSLLLPLYKRLVVEPTVRWVPAKIAPNAITHAGHILNVIALILVAVWGSGPLDKLVCVAAIVLTQLYNWCDNADGAHARRTGQCSATGELLDHGLDLLSSVYISGIGAFAIGAPPMWTLVIVLVVVGAAASTFWEQAVSGVFQLGWLNQIESVFALTILLAIRVIAGPEGFAWMIGPLPFWLVLAIAVCANALLTIVQAPFRVWRRGRPLWTFVPLAAFGASVMIAALGGALAPSAAIAVGIAGYVFLGVRQLTMRIERRPPPSEPGVLAMTLLLLLVAGAHAFGLRPSMLLDVAIALTAIAFFGAYAARNTRDAYRAVRALDHGRA